MGTTPMPQEAIVLSTGLITMVIMSRATVDGLTWQHKQKIRGIKLADFIEREALKAVRYGQVIVHEGREAVRLWIRRNNQIDEEE